MEVLSPCFFTAREDKQYVVSFEICNRCNLNCQHCMNKATDSSFEGLPAKRICSLLKELHDYGVNHLYISGGEPLLHTGFDEIVSYAASLGIHMILATNGLEVPKHLEPIKANIDDVSISIDGIGKTHDKLRGVEGAFDKAVESIDLLIRNGVYTRLSVSLWKENINQLRQIADLAVEKGISKINLSILVPIGRAAENDILIPWSEYPGLIQQIGKIREEYKQKGTLELVLRRSRVLDDSSIDCFGSECIFHIDSKGRISPCSWCSKADHYNLFSMQWEEGNLARCVEKSKSFLSLVHERKELFGYSGCPAMALFTNGSFYKEDPINDMMKGLCDE